MTGSSRCRHRLNRNVTSHLEKVKETLTSTCNKSDQPQVTTNPSNWSFEQQLLYYRFSKINKERLQKHQFSKKYNKFAKMSEYITSKSVSQCRSHFQKTLKKHKNIEQFLLYFEQKLKGKAFIGKKTAQAGTQTYLFQQNNEQNQQQSKGRYYSTYDKN